MPKLPRISSKKAIKALESLGFVQTRQTGSHVIMKKTTSDGQIGCVVPVHRELKIGTLSDILKQARVSPEKFIDSL
ncbi:MAG: addiction module toxin, HicA family [Pleurocapsa sp. SU_5_0]|nr:addiction module toxin, HicA family [Pleurocapsa sp. SU_5_0]NJR45377.1 addiction module toxin, HicA family [Hyellaceae cyanobacterium CSU_1_1]